MIKRDYADKPCRDPVERGDTLAHVLLGFVALFVMWFVLLWLAGGQ
jgi:hypothetical protein